MMGKVNTSESLLNVVRPNQPKMLLGWGQKGKWTGDGAIKSASADDGPPAERRDLPPSGTYPERGKPVFLLNQRKVNRKGSR